MFDFVFARRSSCACGRHIARRRRLQTRWRFVRVVCEVVLRFVLFLCRARCCLAVLSCCLVAAIGVFVGVVVVVVGLWLLMLLMLLLLPPWSIQDVQLSLVFTSHACTSFFVETRFHTQVRCCCRRRCCWLHLQWSLDPRECCFLLLLFAIWMYFYVHLVVGCSQCKCCC